MGNYIGRVEFLNRKDKNHRIKAEFYKDDQIFTGKIYSLIVIVSFEGSKKIAIFSNICEFS